MVKLTNYNTEALQTASTLRKGTNVDSISGINMSGFFNTFAALANPSIGINFSNLLPSSNKNRFSNLFLQLSNFDKSFKKIFA
jgi:hypothetical protein